MRKAFVYTDHKRRERDMAPYVARCVSCGRGNAVQYHGERCVRCERVSTGKRGA